MGCGRCGRQKRSSIAHLPDPPTYGAAERSRRPSAVPVLPPPISQDDGASKCWRHAAVSEMFSSCPEGNGRRRKTGQRAFHVAQHPAPTFTAYANILLPGVVPAAANRLRPPS
eukprot:361791-Chlamydomonas_euryale.AAC.17